MSNLIGSFQTRVNLNNPYAVEGDFASANPRATVLTPDSGAFVAGASGVIIGHFAWVEADGRTVSSYGEAGSAPSGFVHRDQQGLLTEYLQASGMLIPPGFPATLMAAGDFFANNAGPSSMVSGDSIYASYADGSILSAAPAVPSSVTATLGSTNTGALGATFTASAHAGDDTRIDVTAVTGFISIGDTVGNVTGITGNQTIVSQDSGGTPNGAGTYVLSGTNTASAVTATCFGNVVKITSSTGLVSVGDYIASAASGFPAGAVVTGIVSGGGVATAGIYTISVRGTSYVASATGMTTYGTVLNVTAITGTLAIGMPITATGGIAAGTSVAGFISGTLGGVGLYSLNIPGTAYTASGTIVITAGGVVTSYKAKSSAAVGELVQISTWGN